MAWFRCVDPSNGGSTVYTYEIKSIDTTPSSAAIRIIKRRNQTIISTQDILYTTVQSSWVTVGDIQIGYPSDWTVKVAIDSPGIIYNGDIYLGGATIITWVYDIVKDIEMAAYNPLAPTPAMNGNITNYMSTSITAEPVV